MKSKNFQKIVLSKCQHGDTPTEIHCDLNDGIDLRAIKQWRQIIRQSGFTVLSTPPDCSGFVRTKGNIQKVEYCVRRKKRV